jgi:SAM-dependent methyltransferase
MLDAYGFEGVSTLADIGCGNGTVLAATLRRHPSIAGLFFDQPDVVARARAAVDGQDIAGRCTFRAGSFFESVPDGADTYFMRHILHDWSDELSLKILGHIRRVIRDNGRVLAVSSITPTASPVSLIEGRPA